MSQINLNQEKSLNKHHVSLNTKNIHAQKDLKTFINYDLMTLKDIRLYYRIHCALTHYGQVFIDAMTEINPFSINTQPSKDLLDLYSRSEVIFRDQSYFTHWF